MNEGTRPCATLGCGALVPVRPSGKGRQRVYCAACARARLNARRRAAYAANEAARVKARFAAAKRYYRRNLKPVPEAPAWAVEG